MINQDCYPFTFVHRSRNCGQGILYVDIYRFKSTKSNLTYLVRVERYEHNMYAVKFYQKNHRLSPKKYQILSHTYEARRIIYTCMNVMFSVYKENPRASFGFIGANCEDESEVNTKRYRVYNKIVATQISEERFEHVENMKKSAYMLINRMELQEYPNLIEEIERTFQELYDFFEGIEGEIFGNSEDFANSNIPVYTPTEFSQIPYWMDEQKSSVLNEAEIPYGKITE